MTPHDPSQCLTCRAKNEDDEHPEVDALLERVERLRERMYPRERERRDLA